MNTEIITSIIHVRKLVSLIDPTEQFENGRVIYGTDQSNNTISHKVGNGVTAYNLLPEMFISDPSTGDMNKSVYDPTNLGIVDDSAKLGGELPIFYATQASFIATQSAYNAVMAIIGNGADVNNIVNTVQELLLVFENFGEQINVAQLLNQLEASIPIAGKGITQNGNVFDLGKILQPNESIDFQDINGDRIFSLTETGFVSTNLKNNAGIPLEQFFGLLILSRINGHIDPNDGFSTINNGDIDLTPGPNVFEGTLYFNNLLKRVRIVRYNKNSLLEAYSIAELSDVNVKTLFSSKEPWRASNQAFQFSINPLGIGDRTINTTIVKAGTIIEIDIEAFYSMSPSANPKQINFQFYVGSTIIVEKPVGFSDNVKGNLTLKLSITVISTNQAFAVGRIAKLESNGGSESIYPLSSSTDQGTLTTGDFVTIDDIGTIPEVNVLFSMSEANPATFLNVQKYTIKLIN